MGNSVPTTVLALLLLVSVATSGYAVTARTASDASASAVAWSYIEALTMSRPVNSTSIDWYSNRAWRNPCVTSGWYCV